MSNRYELPLLPSQSSFFNFWAPQMANPSSFIVGVQAVVDAGIDASVIERVLLAAWTRHHSLHSTFRGADKSSRHEVDPDMAASIQMMDISSFDNSMKESIPQSVINEERYAFDLVNGPLCKFFVFTLGEHTLIAVLAHHLVADAYSLSVLRKEILDDLHERILTGNERSFRAGSYEAGVEAVHSVAYSRETQNALSHWISRSRRDRGSLPCIDPLSERVTRVPAHRKLDFAISPEMFSGSRNLGDSVRARVGRSLSRTFGGTIWAEYVHNGRLISSASKIYRPLPSHSSRAAGWFAGSGGVFFPPANSSGDDSAYLYATREHNDGIDAILGASYGYLRYDSAFHEFERQVIGSGFGPQVFLNHIPTGVAGAVEATAPSIRYLNFESHPDPRIIGLPLVILVFTGQVNLLSITFDESQIARAKMNEFCEMFATSGNQ